MNRTPENTGARPQNLVMPPAIQQQLPHTVSLGRNLRDVLEMSLETSIYNLRSSERVSCGGEPTFSCLNLNWVFRRIPKVTFVLVVWVTCKLLIFYPDEPEFWYLNFIGQAYIEELFSCCDVKELKPNCNGFGAGHDKLNSKRFMSYRYHSYKTAFKMETRVSICYKTWSVGTAAFWGCCAKVLNPVAFYTILVIGKKSFWGTLKILCVLCTGMVMTIGSANKLCYTGRDKTEWKVMVFIYMVFGFVENVVPIYM